MELLSHHTVLLGEGRLSLSGLCYTTLCLVIVLVYLLVRWCQPRYVPYLNIVEIDI